MVNRLYRFLLRLCPADFREDYGAEMARLFRDRCRREGAFRVLAEAIPDLFVTAWRQQMDTLRRDLIQTLRMLRRNFGFASVSILSLALGIAVNTAIFSVVNGVILEPLPYREPDRIVRLYEQRPEQGRLRNPVSAPDYLDWKAQATAFESIVAMGGDRFTLTGDGEPESVRGANISADFFRTFGITPTLGRDFLPGEATPGVRVAILSYGIWQRRFGGDRAVVGRTVHLTGIAYTIVGVLPNVALTIRSEAPQFDPEIWTPLVLGNDLPRTMHYLAVFGRMKPGVTLAQARADLDIVSGGLERQYANENAGHRAGAFPATEELTGEVRPALLLLLGAVGLVLLIACANVANLSLSRTVSRRREISIRAAIGAGTSRIVRQLLTENLVIAILGGGLGVLLATYGVKSLVAADPAMIPRLAQVRVDQRVLGFTLLISVLSGVLVGLVPAIYGARAGLGEALRSRGAGGSRNAARGVFVVAEVALALMLSVGAALMIQSFTRLASVQPGYDVHGVLAADIPLNGPAYDRREAVIAFYREVIRRLESQPGVRSAAATSALPLTGADPGSNFVVEGRPPLPYAQQPNARFRAVTAGYFETLRMTIRTGRSIAPSDHENAPAVAAINETLARQYFPNEDPIGKRIQLSGATGKNPWREIVAVVADVKHTAMNAQTRPELFLPFPQAVQYSMTIVVRSASSPEHLAGAIRRELAAVDRGQPIRAMRTGEELLAGSVAQPRLYSMLLAVFSGVALLLAAVGIYGVMSFTVGQRTEEMGLRMALGAHSGAVVAMVVRQGLKLALIGVAAGVAGALAATRFLAKLLFGIAPHDPATFAGAALLLTAVAAIACYVPARRAARADPMTALRCD